MIAEPYRCPLSSFFQWLVGWYTIVTPQKKIEHDRIVMNSPYFSIEISVGVEAYEGASLRTWLWNLGIPRCDCYIENDSGFKKIVLFDYRL